MRFMQREYDNWHSAFELSWFLGSRVWNMRLFQAKLMLAYKVNKTDQIGFKTQTNGDS